MMITSGKHVADFKQAWFRRSMHISFIKDPRPCGCRWLASKSLFPVVGISAPASGIKEISDLPPTQHHYTDHSEESTPFGNQTMQNPWKIRKSMENPWKIHGTSENPWKIHGNFSRVSEFPKLAFFFWTATISKYPLRPDVPRWGDLDLWRPERGTSSCHLWSWPNKVWLGYFATKNIKNAMLIFKG